MYTHTHTRIHVHKKLKYIQIRVHRCLHMHTHTYMHGHMGIYFSLSSTCSFVLKLASRQLFSPLGVSDIMLVAWPWWEYFIAWKLSNPYIKGSFPHREPIYRHTTVSMSLASPIRLWIPLGLWLWCPHPLIPTGPRVCLLYSRLQRMEWVNRTKGEWMKAKERIKQKWTS